ncbi:MAG: DUF4351 domain-containing protein [Alcaligenaceae bacterium]|nr:DUF4351 domain-containing protein [Alcaligenaceae bacterium]
MLIDEGALLRAGSLPDANLAGLLFRLEHSTAIEQIPEILHTLMDAVQGAGFEELNRSLAAYIQHLVLSRAQPQEAVPQVTSLQELAMLISEKPGMWARQWKREGILEGRKEGREEGFQEGRQEGQAALLERQLIHKFGPLPDTLVQRIHTGSAAELEVWALNFVDADSIEQVFASTQSPSS